MASTRSPCTRAGSRPTSSATRASTPTISAAPTGASSSRKVPILLEQDSGTIVNVSSVFGLIGWPTQSAYCASKFAVRGYTESLRHELRDCGVDALAVHPGGIATNIVRNSRFHADDLGRTDRGELEREFANQRAAEIIHKGVESGRDRILVGADANVLSLLARSAPVRYFKLIKRIEPIVRR